jgi:hypothetical protein
MINYEKHIIDALQQAVKTVVGTGSSIPKVKYLNTTFVPLADKPYWEIVYFPNNLPNEFWGDEKTYKGAMRLILHWPQDNKGAYLPMAEVARVATALAKGSVWKDSLNIVEVTIDDHPNATGVIEQSPENLLPLTVRYSCFRVS